MQVPHRCRRPTGHLLGSQRGRGVSGGAAGLSFPLSLAYRPSPRGREISSETIPAVTGLQAISWRRGRGRGGRGGCLLESYIGNRTRRGPAMAWRPSPGGPPCGRSSAPLAPHYRQNPQGYPLVDMRMISVARYFDFHSTPTSKIGSDFHDVRFSKNPNLEGLDS